MQRGLDLVAAGAGIVDIGVLSGRTDTAPITVAEEIERLCPVVQALAEAGVLVSVDTWRAETIAAAVDAGARADQRHQRPARPGRRRHRRELRAPGLS